MSHDNWVLIKNKKNFNVNVYRRGLTLIIASLFLSGIFGVLMFYIYLHHPEREYYATSGITPPVKLTSMSAPNASSKALLDVDPPTEKMQKVIPQ